MLKSATKMPASEGIMASIRRSFPGFSMLRFVYLSLVGLVIHNLTMNVVLVKDHLKPLDISGKFFQQTATHTLTLNATSKEAFVPLQPSVSIEDSQPDKFQHYTFDCQHMHATLRDEKADILVIDYVNLNTEIDLLEIRVMSLKDHVDFFIVAESKQTYSGKSKPLHYLDQVQGRLEKQGLINTNKIIHVIIDSFNSTDSWVIEKYQRDTGLKMGLDKINKLGRKVGPGDALVICDLDEQPRPQVLEGLKMCQAYPQKMRLGLAFFYYSFEYMLYKSIWTKAFIHIISPGEDVLEIRASTERGDGSDGTIIRNAGWHCSYCFPNLTDIINKLHSFAHQEFNKPPWTNRDRILFCVRYGISLFDTCGFMNLGRHLDMPTHLLANIDRFSFLVDRRNAYSGFLDVRSEMNTTAE